MNSRYFKKGQIKLVFPLIAALLIVVVLIFVGFGGVDDILSSKKTADLITFSNNIQLSLQRNNNYGSVTQERFALPTPYSILCVVDSKHFKTNTQSTASFVDDFDVDVFGNLSSEEVSAELVGLIKGSVSAGVSTNIFLLTHTRLWPVGYSPYIVLDKEKDVICAFSRQGRLLMQMNGQGRTTKVSFP